MDFITTMNVGAGGMAAQSLRMRIAAENMANANSIESADGPGPYRAKQVTFQSYMNPKTGATEVRAGPVTRDTVTPLTPVYDPGNRLADANGFVMHPNVDSTVESVNMREAQRSYEANMNVITTAREMATRTLDMMR